MIDWIYRVLGKESALKKEDSGKYKVVQKRNLLDAIRASKELGNPFGVARVRYPNQEVLENILEAVNGEYSSVRQSQVSFVTYMREDCLVDELSRIVPDVSGLELQLTWYENPSMLRVGDIYKGAHDTQKIDKSYELSQKSA
jgi:hypothetical protein